MMISDLHFGSFNIRMLAPKALNIVAYKFCLNVELGVNHTSTPRRVGPRSTLVYERNDYLECYEVYLVATAG